MLHCTLYRFHYNANVNLLTVGGKEHISELIMVHVEFVLVALLAFITIIIQHMFGDHAVVVICAADSVVVWIVNIFGFIEIFKKFLELIKFLLPFCEAVLFPILVVEFNYVYSPGRIAQSIAVKKCSKRESFVIVEHG